MGKRALLSYPREHNITMCMALLCYEEQSTTAREIYSVHTTIVMQTLISLCRYHQTLPNSFLCLEIAHTEY